MRIYINDNTQEVLSKIINGHRGLLCNEFNEVHSFIRYDSNKIVRLEYCDVNCNKEYLEFVVDKKDADMFERKIYNVFPCAIEQFIKKEIIEGMFEDSIMFSLKVKEDSIEHKKFVVPEVKGTELADTLDHLDTTKNNCSNVNMMLNNCRELKNRHIAIKLLTEGFISQETYNVLINETEPIAPKEYVYTYEELKEDNSRLIKEINKKDKEIDYLANVIGMVIEVVVEEKRYNRKTGMIE